MKTLYLKNCMMVIAITSCLIAELPAKTIYVKTDGIDTNDGLTWGNSKQTIAAAITAAVADDQIWIKGGSYTATATTGIGVSKNLSFYGGFIGSETDLAERDWATNKTIISGSGSGRVFNLNNTNLTNTTLDGLIIQDGNSANGAGIYCKTTSSLNVTIKNCIIRNNFANTSGGAGIQVDAAAVTVLVYNTLFINNQSTTIAPVANVNGTAKFYNCTFANNKGIKVGTNPVIYIAGPNCEVNNCIFWNNKSQNGVTAGVYDVFAGIYANASGTAASINNNAADGVLVSNAGGVNPVVTNSVLLDNDNTAANGPNFRAPGSVLGYVTDVSTLYTLDYSLQGVSICINAGNNAYATDNYDLAKNIRKYGINVDLGAYEYDGSKTSITCIYNTYNLVSVTQDRIIKSNVEGSIQVLTITGIILKNEQVTNGQVINLPSGAYIVRMHTSNGYLVQKIVL